MLLCYGWPRLLPEGPPQPDTTQQSPEKRLFLCLTRGSGVRFSRLLSSGNRRDTRHCQSLLALAHLGRSPPRHTLLRNGCYSSLSLSLSLSLSRAQFEPIWTGYHLHSGCGIPWFFRGKGMVSLSLLRRFLISLMSLWRQDIRTEPSSLARALSVHNIHTPRDTHS